MKLRLSFSFKQLILTATLVYFQFIFFFSENDFFILFDEIVAIILTIYLLLWVLYNSKMYRLSLKVLVLIVVLCMIGITGNVISGVDRSIKIILFDMFSCIKLFLTFAGVLCIKVTEDDWNVIIRSVAKVVQMTVITAFMFLLLNQLWDLGMLDDYRYGVHTFKFIFLNAGTLTTVCYGYILVMTLVIPSLRTEKEKNFNLICILLTMIVWISTMRSRAFAFAAAYGCLYFYYFKIKKNVALERKNRIRLWQILFIGVVLGIIGLSSLEFYFTNTATARYQLLHASLELASEHFPLGAGFATFGTNISKQYYSPLFHKFGFNSIYGLSENMSDFLTDNCWPAILGEFGVAGVIIYIILIWFLVKFLYKKLKYNEYYYFAFLFFSIVFIGSSVATQTLFHYAPIGWVLLMVFVAQKEKV